MFGNCKEQLLPVFLEWQKEQKAVSQEKVKTKEGEKTNPRTLT
jgi:hypothetical protein